MRIHSGRSNRLIKRWQRTFFNGTRTFIVQVLPFNRHCMHLIRYCPSLIITHVISSDCYVYSTQINTMKWCVCVECYRCRSVHLFHLLLKSIVSRKWEKDRERWRERGRQRGSIFFGHSSNPFSSNGIKSTNAPKPSSQEHKRNNNFCQMASSCDATTKHTRTHARIVVGIQP